jgi:hypothetical protein
LMCARLTHAITTTHIVPTANWGIPCSKRNMKGHWGRAGCLVSHESWLSNLTNKRLRRGRFVSVPAMKRAIKEFIEAHNSHPKPLVWTKDADEILHKVRKIQHLLVTGH